MHENLQAQIISTYEAVANALRVLCLHIRTEFKNLPLWVIDGEVFNADRNKLIDALNNFGPTPGLMPQETFSCPGAVACILKTLGLIEQVNAAKTAFKTQIALFKQQTTASRNYGILEKPDGSAKLIRADLLDSRERGEKMVIEKTKGYQGIEFLQAVQPEVRARSRDHGISFGGM